MDPPASQMGGGEKEILHAEESRISEGCHLCKHHAARKPRDGSVLFVARPPRQSQRVRTYMGALHATRHLRILNELQQYGRRRRTSRAEQDGVVYAKTFQRRKTEPRRKAWAIRGSAEGPRKGGGRDRKRDKQCGTSRVRTVQEKSERVQSRTVGNVPVDSAVGRSAVMSGAEVAGAVALQRVESGQQ